MKKIAIFMAAAVLAGALSGCAALRPASEPTNPIAPQATPVPEKQYQYLGAEEVKTMIEEGAPKLIVDIQPEEYYNIGHLPNSIPTYAYPADTQELQALLGEAAAQIKAVADPVIIVGLGGKTGAENAVDYYEANGVAPDRLFILEGGAVSWPYDELTYWKIEYQYITPDDLAKNLRNGTNMMIIDVRTADEYGQGHLPGSISTDSFPNRTAEQWAELDKLIEQIEATIDPIVLVCPTGGPGAINAINHYAAKGIDHRKFYILSGGGKTWPHPELLEVTPQLQYVTAEDMAGKIQAGEEMLILSVQTKENYREVGHLPNSIATYAYPADTASLREELGDEAETLAENNLPIYVMSHSGETGAANAITYYVNEHDIPAERFFIIEGGIANWPYPGMLETGR